MNKERGIKTMGYAWFTHPPIRNNSYFEVLFVRY
jgi:hypothetical protein